MTRTTVRRECCNYCMWFGPVNQDDTIRKHRPATSEDRYGRKVQNKTEGPCPGSNKPYARFGCDTEETNPVNDQKPTTAGTAADLPKGTRVTSSEGRMGTVNGVDVGRVTIKGHPNYGREYVGVDWDADEKCPWGDRSRPFVDELVIVSSAEASTDEASTDEASTDEVTEAARHGETVKLHRELCGDQPKRKTPDLRQLANPEKADPEAVAEIHASRCPECKGAGCPQCGYKGTPRTVCPKHHVVDKRGGRSIELGAIPACEPITYGAWSEGAGGFVYTGDCATEVANWAADELRQLAKEDDTDKFEILAICPDHEEQPKHSCQECNAEAAEHEETDEAEAPTRFLVDPHTWLRRSY